ncbi:Xenobiotic-transporting ATPase protein [Dioscorea alata]|uniref:Xenobiotic-transporting ATPase protein n=1 Tax=Dioscorea alata TaxID=55571 RepID=A0ACB7W479_DIOAL|nr:Xenobiotic-transporting ATPase protein [Dioscorea alata]
MDVGPSKDESNTNYFIISINAILFVVLLTKLIYKVSSRKNQGQSLFYLNSWLRVSSAVYNGFLGMIYLVIAVWMFVERPKNHPRLWWLVVFSQGITLVLIVVVVSIRTSVLGCAFAKIWSEIATISTSILCFHSTLNIIAKKEKWTEFFIILLSLPGVILVLVCAFISSKTAEDDCKNIHDGLHQPVSDWDASVTPFANAGFMNKMSFWWLNSLMRKGCERPLEEKDMPVLHEPDRAESCYNVFVEQWNKQKQTKPSASPNFLWTIVSCHKQDLLMSAFFALLTVLSSFAGPVLLKDFINVASGNRSIKNEGYLLVLVLFIAKCLECLSQRQWYFRTTLLGLKVRSLLTAVIYQKQFRLSNSAKLIHSSGKIMNYVTVDAYRIGEFLVWFHHTWTTGLQLCIALIILYNAVGLAMIVAFSVVVLTVLCNAPLAKQQHKFQTKLMEAEDERLKAMTEALMNMKVLKLYAWDTHFKKVIEGLRSVECNWLSAFQLRRAYTTFLFWSSPIWASGATFLSCYLMHVPLNAKNVFTFVATLRLVQNPVKSVPDVIRVVIQAKVAFSRIVRFLNAPELLDEHANRKCASELQQPIIINSCGFSWDGNASKQALRNINLEVHPREKVAICGEVGAGKSTLLAAILGEIPKVEGTINICGKVAYVSQCAWIQTGTVQDNILFGSPMDNQRYKETIEKCSLVKDIEMLPFGDLTEIGERGVNLSGGQKQRIQLARALYQDADIYLLDDPFSAVDAHTATSLFNDYVMGALSTKTVLLVTHQVDFLPAVNCILLLSDGEILGAAPYNELLASSKEFQDLVNAHTETVSTERLQKVAYREGIRSSRRKVNHSFNDDQQNKANVSKVNQLIKEEERETGDAGWKPYILYLNQNKGFFYVSLSVLSQIIYIAGQISQNSLLAANLQKSQVSTLRLISVYLAIGLSVSIFLFTRSLFMVVLSVQSSKSLFSQLLSSLFRAPMSFFDSTPMGRILSRVSSDLSIVDLDVPFTLILSISATLNLYCNLGVLAVITPQILFVVIPVIYVSIKLQKYYFASAKELMRINGTTKSLVANHLAESLSGAMTIRAFKEEDRFFAKSLELIDKNASPFFLNFASAEWLNLHLEMMSAAVLCSSALVLALLPPGTFSPGFVGMALSYGLTLSRSLLSAIQSQCTVANNIISVERLNQYMHVSSEAPVVISENRPAPNWPSAGRVELHDLKIRYRPDTLLVLQGISCTFEGGHKIGIVGRTGCGKTTLIAALFRLVEPAGGKIVIDGIDISSIGLHDLRSRYGIIPQDPTLFNGSVRYNLDPLGQHTDTEIWEVLDKCQLREAVQEKEKGLDSLVVEDGSNWSMGQRQLFCLGRALLRRSRILVLDEATASIDNATDAILQKTIRTEFEPSTVITVAHRIPTVMDCTMVLAICDGKLVEYDEPIKLMKREGSLFGELVKEYWSHSAILN